MAGCCGGKYVPKATPVRPATQAPPAAVERTVLRFFVGEQAFDTIRDARVASDDASVVIEPRRVVVPVVAPTA